MPELFGFQAGQRLAEKDQIEQQLANLSLEQGQQQLRRGEVAIKRDEVDLKNAEATLSRQTEFLKLLKQSEGKSLEGSAGTPVSEDRDLATRLDELAELSMKSGFPEEAANYASKASQIKNNNSLIKSRENDERNRRLVYAAGLLDNVQDEQSWMQANMLYSIEFGEESPFANLPYSEELIGRIKDSVTTQRQKSLIEAANNKADQADEDLAKIKSQIELNKARERLTKAREQNLKKTGDETVVPKAADLKAVTDLLTKEFGGAGLPEDIRVIARPIAERMMKLKKENGLSQSEAATLAVKEAKENGDLGGLKPRRPSPGSAQNPLPLPREQKNYKENMYYVPSTGKYAGQTLLWTGKGFKKVKDK